MSIDLHLHTTASDGRLSPEQVVDLAAERGLSVIAITDHDTVEGIQAALNQAQKHPGLTVIPGIELSTHAPGGEFHLLGYFIDYLNPELLSVCRSVRSDRFERAKAMVKKLNALGIKLSWERVCQIARESNIGRPHIARALLEKGYISSFEEAFELYLGQGKPAYVERFKITPAEAIELVGRCSGLPVMAHPLTVNNYEETIAKLSACGLEGIEVYYKDFDSSQRENLLKIARKLNLVATGGSDYHGIDDSVEVLPGDAGVPRSVATGLFTRARQKGLTVPVYEG